jgi:ribose transport system substrate-binding protein
MRSRIDYFVVPLLFALFVACNLSASPIETQTERRIYYFIPTLMDEFQTESQLMIEQVFKAEQYKVISVNAGGDPELQLRQLMSAATDMPAAIIVNAVDSISIASSLRDIRLKNIPVLVYDRMLEDPNEFDFASVADAKAIGQMAAERAIELLRSGSGSSEHRAILQIVGDPGDSYSLRVLGGFRAGLTDAENVSIVTVPAMGWEPYNARSIVEKYLKEHPEVLALGTEPKDYTSLGPTLVVFCHSGDLAAAIIPLLEPAIKVGKAAVMAITGAPAGLENLAVGLEKFEIEQPLYAQVYGLALGLHEITALKNGLSRTEDGRCDILGVPGRLERGGKILSLQGRLVRVEDLAHRKDYGLWGDLARPLLSLPEITNLRCGGR